MGDAAKWIKVATDTFEDEKIDLIEGLPGGEKFILIWFKILLLAGKCNSGGYLLLQEKIPFTAKMLARRFNQELGTVNKALKEFEKYKMIQRTEEGIYVTNFNKHQDLDKMNQKRIQDRERKQKQREKEKLSNEETEVIEEGEYVSQMMSQKNQCDITCDKECDTSYSTSTSISRSKSDNKAKLIVLKNKAYIEFFNNNFHEITEYEQEILVGYENKGMNSEVITLALKEAVEENAKDMKYVKKILDRWLIGNILTVAAAADDKAEFEKRKNMAKAKDKKVYEKASNFNNFQQRNYDFNSLEKKLLGWEKVGS